MSPLSPAMAPLPHHVLGVVLRRSGKQMRATGTGRVIAVMQHTMAFWDRPYLKFVADLVSFAEFVTFSYLPVAVGLTMPRPLPARTKLGAVLRDWPVLVDILPEALE